MLAYQVRIIRWTSKVPRKRHINHALTPGRASTKADAQNRRGTGLTSARDRIAIATGQIIRIVDTFEHIVVLKPTAHNTNFSPLQKTHLHKVDKAPQGVPHQQSDPDIDRYLRMTEMTPIQYNVQTIA